MRDAPVRWWELTAPPRKRAGYGPAVRYKLIHPGPSKRGNSRQDITATRCTSGKKAMLRKQNFKNYWEIKNSRRTPTISWKFLTSVRAYKNGRKNCHLCLTEKLLVMKNRDTKLLNSRSSLVRFTFVCFLKFHTCSPSDITTARIVY